MDIPEGFENFKLKVINGLYVRSDDSDFDKDYMQALYFLKQMAEVLQNIHNNGSLEKYSVKTVLDEFKEWK